MSFSSAIELSLLSRAGRCRRTLAEVRQCCRRILQARPQVADMPVRGITPEFCRELITSVFETPAMQRKARCLLYSIFAFSERRGWCKGNPLAAVDLPPARERPVEVLSLPQLRCLLAVARLPEHRVCAPALGLMLWAGIRPAELTRLRWLDVRMEARIIDIDARLAEAGYARQVTLYPVLEHWLHETAAFRLPGASVVPRAWARRWRALRLAAGMKEWNPDALRHTFAAYHLRHFGDAEALQHDMGREDIQLLRKRYQGIESVTPEGAAEFWTWAVAAST